MKKYLLRHRLRNKNHGTYLKIKYGSKHYVVEKEEASLFTKAAAINMRNSFNHPDFWEIINIYIPADKSKRFNPIWKKK